MPTIERRLVLGGARRAVAARRHHLTRRVVAEVLREQPRARRAEGLGRTTKQLGCVSNDGVVDLDLARLVRARLPRVFRHEVGHARRAPRRRLSLSLSLLFAFMSVLVWTGDHNKSIAERLRLANTLAVDVLIDSNIYNALDLGRFPKNSAHTQYVVVPRALDLCFLRNFKGGYGTCNSQSRF